MSQAYLFHGPEHVGKFTLAKIFAEAIISGKDIKSHNTSILRSIEVNDDGTGSLNLPDLIIVQPEKEEKKGITKIKDIKIEQIREAQRQLATFPYSGKFKVLIIDDAEMMTLSAQNSLLKTLEEPNSTSVIILIAHEMKNIISTIISRCQKSSFFLVDLDEIAQIYPAEKNTTTGEYGELSLGRPGIAEKIYHGEKDAEELDKIREMRKIQGMTINEKLNFAEAVSKNPDLTKKVLEAWIWQLRNETKNNQDTISQNFGLIEKIEQALTQLSETNANPRLAVEALLISI